MNVYGYSQFTELLNKNPGIAKGIIIDTNILVAATYDLDKFNEDALIFLDCLVAEKIPLFCNVNIRSEFLEIHRRILFSEAILDFERDCKKNLLSPTLSSMLTNYRMKYERRQKNKPDEPPLKLSESEIKDFKMEMVQIKSNTKDLWTELCESRIGNKLGEVWSETEKSLNLNFLSLREDDQRFHLNEKPNWDSVTTLMSSRGLSSSDSMILNMFFVSKFEAIASSDVDIAYAVITENRNNKICIIPNSLLRVITDMI